MRELSPGDNNDIFTGLPRSLADDPGAMRTDALRNRSFRSADVSWACESDAN